MYRTIERAYRMVEEVRNSMCNEISICTCCGLKNYKDKTEWQMRQKLDACLTRLADVAAHLKAELEQQTETYNHPKKHRN